MMIMMITKRRWKMMMKEEVEEKTVEKINNKIIR